MSDLNSSGTFTPESTFISIFCQCHVLNYHLSPFYNCSQHQVYNIVVVLMGETQWTNTDKTIGKLENKIERNLMYDNII